LGLKRATGVSSPKTAKRGVNVKPREWYRVPGIHGHYSYEQKKWWRNARTHVKRGEPSTPLLTRTEGTTNHMDTTRGAGKEKDPEGK